MSEHDEARLSKLLFEAREQVDMFIDIVEAQGLTSLGPTRVRDELDAYRTERGWSPDGFGCETTGA